MVHKLPQPVIVTLVSWQTTANTLLEYVQAPWMPAGYQKVSPFITHVAFWHVPRKITSTTHLWEQQDGLTNKTIMKSTWIPHGTKSWLGHACTCMVATQRLARLAMLCLEFPTSLINRQQLSNAGAFAVAQTQHAIIIQTTHKCTTSASYTCVYERKTGLSSLS